MSTFNKLASTFMLVAATLGVGNVIGCSVDENIQGDEVLGEADLALTADQCEYFDVNGSVQICHELGNGKFKILRVNEQACVNAFSGFPNDYVTSTDPASPLYDPTCQGNGCLPTSAPCDATVPCCDGAACTNGVCAAAADPCAPNPCAEMETCVSTGNGNYYCEGPSLH
ncbi:MAG TPA: hypothetical protein PK156_05655 [Polyangium sp.]|nr:hypothetical protein [Polyangium sp.]